MFTLQTPLRAKEWHSVTFSHKRERWTKPNTSQPRLQQCSTKKILYINNIFYVFCQCWLTVPNKAHCIQIHTFHLSVIILKTVSWSLETVYHPVNVFSDTSLYLIHVILLCFWQGTVFWSSGDKVIKTSELSDTIC